MKYSIVLSFLTLILGLNGLTTEITRNKVEDSPFEKQAKVLIKKESEAKDVLVDVLRNNEPKYPNYKSTEADNVYNATKNTNTSNEPNRISTYAREEIQKSCDQLLKSMKATDQYLRLTKEDRVATTILEKGCKAYQNNCFETIKVSDKAIAEKKRNPKLAVDSVILNKAKECKSRKDSSDDFNSLKQAMLILDNDFPRGKAIDKDFSFLFMRVAQMMDKIPKEKDETQNSAFVANPAGATPVSSVNSGNQ
jgi:uncharacterized protein YdiU (UPF0061 family)